MEANAIWTATITIWMGAIAIWMEAIVIWTATIAIWTATIYIWTATFWLAPRSIAIDLIYTTHKSPIKYRYYANKCVSTKLA
jgi:hypothetical protein